MTEGSNPSTSIGEEKEDQIMTDQNGGQQQKSELAEERKELDPNAHSDNSSSDALLISSNSSFIPNRSPSPAPPPAPSPAPLAPEEIQSVFDRQRPVRTLLPPTHQVTLPIRLLNSELTCSICLGIIRDCVCILVCLHRFCAACMEKSLRLGSKQCPQCRISCPSKRNLRSDPTFDRIIRSIYPDLDSAEEAQDKAMEKMIEQSNVSQFAESALKGARKQAERARQREEEKRIKDEKERHQRETQFKLKAKSKKEFKYLSNCIYGSNFFYNINVYFPCCDSLEAEDVETITFSLYPHPALASTPGLASRFKLQLSNIRTSHQVNVFLLKKYLQIKFFDQEVEAEVVAAAAEKAKAIYGKESGKEEKESEMKEEEITAGSQPSVSANNSVTTPFVSKVVRQDINYFNLWFRYIDMSNIAKKIYEEKKKHRKVELAMVEIEKKKQQESNKETNQQEEKVQDNQTDISNNSTTLISTSSDLTPTSNPSNAATLSSAANTRELTAPSSAPIPPSPSTSVGPTYPSISGTTDSNIDEEYLLLLPESTLKFLRDYVWDFSKSRRLTLYYGTNDMPPWKGGGDGVSYVEGKIKIPTATTKKETVITRNEDSLLEKNQVEQQTNGQVPKVLASPHISLNYEGLLDVTEIPFTDSPAVMSDN